MIRTQIQLPEPLYREVQRVARSQEWSIAEVIRRGAEAVVRAYPKEKDQSPEWRLPPPLEITMLISDPDDLKTALGDDQEFLIR